MQRLVQNFSRQLLPILVAIVAQIPIIGAHGTTILAQPDNGSTVWTGNDPLPLDAAQIGAVVGEPGLGLFYDAGFGKARITTSGGGNAEVVFTAVHSGIAGHGITIEVVTLGVANSPLSVSVNGQAIRISLATDSSGAAVSTATQVAAAVNASPAASGLVVASAGGNGAGVVQSLSATPLAPVIVETGPFVSSYQTVFANSASFPQDASVAYGGGASIAASALFLYVRDTGQVPAFYIYDLLAPEFSWNGLEGLSLSGFWPNDGAIEQLKIVGIASTSTPVPEASSLALLALGIGVLILSRRRSDGTTQHRSSRSLTVSQE